MIHGLWVRASKYEIREGPHGLYLAAAPGTSFEVFDPWDERMGDAAIERVSGVRAGQRAEQAPYETLTDLLALPGLDRARVAMAPQLSLDAERAVLNWCRRYGLLGLGLHEHRAITMAGERWEWTGGTWITGPGSRHLRLEAAPSGVERRPLGGSGDWASAPLWHWRGYFPDLEDAPESEIPRPLGAGFWQGYAEPLEEFLQAAHLLSDVLAAASRTRGDDGVARRMRVALFFNKFLDRVHPIVALGSSRPWEGRWSAPSLLAVLAMMGRDDLMGASLHGCASPDCRRLFRSKAHAATYCSDRCRSRETKRRKAAISRQSGGE